jgi:sulfate adenylyltransferase subunit 2
MKQYYLNHLKELEHESIYIIREVAAQFERPAILFSGGKDSIVMSHLARKAFAPAKIPFPLVHIDTGHNFVETIEYRDWFMNDIGANLIVGMVQDSIDRGTAKEQTGLYATRNMLQTVTLLETIEKYQFDACMGGARRDEEKARAKERFFSYRDEFGQWNPKNQRPELWSLYNGRKNKDESFRIFPLSNWTELDVWQYIKAENIPLPSIYFTHNRKVVKTRDVILAYADYLKLRGDEEIVDMQIRFRTIGDVTCTGAVESTANSLDEIIAEIESTTTTERGTRADDKLSETAMEDRKKQGYF